MLTLTARSNQARPAVSAAGRQARLPPDRSSTPNSAGDEHRNPAALAVPARSCRVVREADGDVREAADVKPERIAAPSAGIEHEADQDEDGAEHDRSDEVVVGRRMMVNAGDEELHSERDPQDDGEEDEREAR